MCHLRIRKRISQTSARDLHAGGLRLGPLLAPYRLVTQRSSAGNWEITGACTGRASVIRRWEGNYYLFVSIYEKPWWYLTWWLEGRILKALEGL